MTRTWVFIAILLSFARLPSLSDAVCWADDTASEGIEAITRPRDDVTLAFMYPGRIARVAVKEGDALRDGALLVQLDDEPDRIELAQLEADKDDQLGIQMAQAKVDEKKSLLQHMEQASAKEAASPLELEQARVEARLADLTLAKEQLLHAQAGRKYEEAKARIDRMALTSPIVGRVEQVFSHVGESVDRLQKVVRVVSTDTFRIDVAVPLARSAGLRCGGEATVRFPGDGVPPGKGKVVFVQAVADAASETILVRVEVANPDARPAGEHVRVSFP